MQATQEKIKSLEDKDSELKHARDEIFTKMERVDKDVEAACDYKRKLEDDIAKAKEQIGRISEGSLFVNRRIA